ncbi:putative protein kinase [Trypanosoma grayi]|uniref:putative protein kinase n=1 Tax=Trypanosoma grayi TaxID=71804 RepID=UPI0004F3FBE4|nr:putative protein kinase [Trypanosoma grayi]KEG15265.1 putative protein kinase [Trypanosoma grayi]
MFGTSLQLCIAGLCLVGTVLFTNIDNRITWNNAIQEAETCGATSILSTVNHTKGILIGVSTACIVTYIVFALALLGFSRHVSRSLERELSHLYDAFDLLSKLQLESVPLYVNEHTDVDVITEKQTFLLERYSDQVELQKVQDVMNNVTLVIRHFRKTLPDTIFKKKMAGVIAESSQREDRGIGTPGAQSSPTLGSINVVGAASSPGRQHAASLRTSLTDYPLTHRSDETRALVSVTRDGRKKFAENEGSYRTLNVSEIHGGVESGLKRRKATLMVACLSGFVPQMDADLRYCHYLSQEFHSLVTDIADKYGGTVLKVTSDRVIVEWNAFSDASSHEKAGMQCVCETIVALDSFIYEVTYSTRMKLTPVVMATSGYILAGTVGTEDERAMPIYGNCVALGEELPSLLITLGVKYACTGDLSESCPGGCCCIPIDCVTDANNNQHVVYEIFEGSHSHHKKLVEAFQYFQAGEYATAERMYCDIYDANPGDEQTFRLGQLCYYLQKSGKIYRRRIPQWQLFPVEVDESTNMPLQKRKDSYHWRKPEASSVEDQLRRAILSRDGTCPPSASSTDGHQVGLAPHAYRARSPSCPASPDIDWRPDITEFRDRQGMIFRMSNRILGTGACGSVSIGLSQTGALVAIKAIELSVIRYTQTENMSSVNRRRLRRKGINVEGNVEEALDAIINEVSLLSRLRHPNIVGYISCAVLDQKLLVVMELASGGSLHNLLWQFSKVKVNRAKRYLRDVLKGLEYLHRKNIVHRDIKPQNVLLLENGLCKLSDFGTSQRLQKISSSNRPEGTPPYIAPEAARGKAEKASDIWSFGIMMAQILSGSLPWPNVKNMTPHVFLYNVGKVESFVPQVDDRISSDAKEIIMRCCRRNPSERPTARKLLADPFFTPTRAYVSSTATNRRSLGVDEIFQSGSPNGSQDKRSYDCLSIPGSRGKRVDSINSLHK